MYWLITEKQVLSQLTKIAMAKIPFVTFSKRVIKNMNCDIQINCIFYHRIWHGKINKYVYLRLKISIVRGGKLLLNVY